tara:strand:- start:390 stop:1481 length:1092 start_codon:yes stop_codon:yes gene_type:complete
MRKLLLTAIATLTILFTQAQCQADFSYMQNGPTTIFTDLSTINPSWSTNYSVSWQWDFGDGTTSTLQNPTHTYSNGIYTPCLIVTYFDSTIINGGCTSVYCDSIFVGNAPPTSWDCNLANGGCYDPGTGNGQYTTLAACQAICGTPTPSWDCPINMPGGCYDPGTGLGQYTSLAACQAVCGTPIPSWDCGPFGCYDPGTGLGQYSSLSACQSACLVGSSIVCDSMTASGAQTQFTLQVNNINTLIDYWVTTGNGNIIAEDSMTTIHTVYNITNPATGLIYDTIVTCITYPNTGAYFTCCVTWIWNGTFWAKMGSITNIGEINAAKKKLVKVVDVLGRETPVNSNQTLFFIYEDGTIERRYIIK